MIRNYKDTDFEACTELVNKVWQFDQHYEPPELAQLFIEIYTGGSLAASNFSKVVEEESCVKGFIFGKIENRPIPKSEYNGLNGQLKILKELFSVPNVSLKAKLSYLNKINTHEVNRRKVENRKSSEVNLFIVDPDFQGSGWGKKLINEFIAICKKEHILPKLSSLKYTN